MHQYWLLLKAISIEVCSFIVVFSIWEMTHSNLSPWLIYPLTAFVTGSDFPTAIRQSFLNTDTTIEGNINRSLFIHFSSSRMCLLEFIYLLLTYRSISIEIDEKSAHAFKTSSKHPKQLHESEISMPQLDQKSFFACRKSWDRRKGIDRTIITDTLCIPSMKSLLSIVRTVSIKLFVSPPRLWIVLIRIHDSSLRLYTIQ